MKLELKMKPSDISLLKVLGCVLIAVVTVSFFLSPMWEKHEELVAQQEELAEEKMQVEDAIMGASSLQNSNEEKQDSLDDATASYYAPMKSNEVDELVTNLAIKHGLFPSALDISESSPGGPSAYGVTEETAEQSEVEQLEEEAEAESTEASTEEPQTVEELIGDPYISDIQYIRTITASITLQGTEEQLYSFLNDIAKNYPSMQVRSMEVSQQTYLDDTLNTVENSSIRCTIAIYTCGNGEDKEVVSTESTD